MEIRDAGAVAPRVRWAPRIRPELIRRLYESEARGILDQELLDEVAYGIHARCRSILRATAAHQGHVECPGCGRILEHNWDKEALLRCEDCHWEMCWGRYHKTYQGKKLYGGQAVEAFEDYVADFERAQNPRQHMLAIDRLLHRFHGELGEWPTSPAARNIIDGNVKEVVTLLDCLAYGDQVPPEILANREHYQTMLARSWVGAGVMPEKTRLKLERRAARNALRYEAESATNPKGA